MTAPRSEPMQYRLLVIAPTVLDAVTGAGGYLFDQSMAGWHVLATVVGDDDTRPLSILGVAATDLQSALRTMCSERSCGVVAVNASLYERDDMRTLLKTIDADVLTWAANCAHSVDHQLSHAARVFKARALEAAAPSATSVAPTERFCTAVPVSRRSGA